MHLSGSTGKTRQGRGMSAIMCRLDRRWHRELRFRSRPGQAPKSAIARGGAGDYISALQALPTNLVRSLGAKEGSMNEEDFQAFVAGLKRFHEQNSTPEAARKILQEEGVLTEDGELAEFYRREEPAGK
jgi:hypothetical protein